MSSSAAQTLQKLYFTILGVPMDVQLQDVFAKKVDAEGWGWLNSIINDYLGFLASTTSHSSVINMLAKNGWGLQMSASDLAFWGVIVKEGKMSFDQLVTAAMDTVGGSAKLTMTQREQVAQRYAVAADLAKKAALDDGAIAQAALKAMLLGVNDTSKSVDQANSALDQFLSSLLTSGVSLICIDGYIRGATVLVDANGNGMLDPGEFSGKTDASGRVVMPPTAPAGKVIATGGTDLLTGKEFTGVLSAPQGATLVTPVSTIIESLVSQGLATDLYTATTQVQTALGIPSTVNALTFDPLASLSSTTDSTANKQAALAFLSVQQQVATVIAQASTSISKGTTAADASNASQAVVTALASAISNSVTGATNGPTTPTTPTTTPTTTPVASFDLKNTTSIQNAVTKAAEINNTTLTTDSLNSIAKVVSQSNTLLNTASQGATIAESLTAMSKTAAVTQGSVVEQLKAAVANITATAPGTTPSTPATPTSISSALSNINTGFSSGEVTKLITAASAGSISEGIKSDAIPGGSITNVNAVVVVPVTPPKPVAPTGGGGGGGGGVGGGGGAPPAESSNTLLLDSKNGTSTSPFTTSANGAQYVFSDDIYVASYTKITDFGSNDLISFNPLAANYLAISSQGGDIEITLNYRGVVSSIVLVNVISVGQPIYNLASFNALPIGDILLTGTDYLQTKSLDGLGGTFTSPVSVVASPGAFSFEDDALTASVVRITNFGTADELRWKNTTASQVAVSSQGTNVTMVANIDGVISSVTFADVVPTGVIVFDIASFNTLSVGDVFFN